MFAHVHAVDMQEKLCKFKESLSCTCSFKATLDARYHNAVQMKQYSPMTVRDVGDS
jgi:hypothetical protein